MPSDIANQIVKQIFGDEKAKAIDSVNDALNSAAYDAVQARKLEFAKSMGFELDQTAQGAADEIDLPDGTDTEPTEVEIDGRKPEDPPAEVEQPTAEQQPETEEQPEEQTDETDSEEITSVDFLCEEKEGKKNYFIEGVFLQAELKNRNGRLYPQKTLAREVAKYDENYIQKGRALGELGHPDGPSINLDRVSHKILSLSEEGNNFIGRAKLLDTPMGQIAKNLLDEGVKLGVSSRGMGSIRKEENCNVVMDDFMLATAADIVADPSAPDAFVDGIMEGKEWVWDNGILKESAVAELKQEIDQATLINIQERKVSAFKKFLQSL